MMNLKTRIAKIEKAIAPGNGFCQCRDVRKKEIWFADLSAESDTTEPSFEGQPVPDTCEKCRRPIEKQIIVLQLVDQTTKDRFPEEWDQENVK